MKDKQGYQRSKTWSLEDKKKNGKQKGKRLEDKSNETGYKKSTPNAAATSYGLDFGLIHERRRRRNTKSKSTPGDNDDFSYCTTSRYPRRRFVLFFLFFNGGGLRLTRSKFDHSFPNFSQLDIFCLSFNLSTLLQHPPLFFSSFFLGFGIRIRIRGRAVCLCSIKGASLFIPLILIVRKRRLAAFFFIFVIFSV